MKSVVNRVGYLIIIVCLIAVLFINNTEAGEVYKWNSTVDLKQSCYNDGAYCSAVASCNITVVNPNGVSMISNRPMTNQIYFHNYSLQPDNTTEIGEYRYNILCSDGTDEDYGSFSFKITGNGKEEPGSTTVVLFSLLFIILMGSLLFLIIYTVAHFVALDFDVIDLAWNVGAYIAVFAMLMLEKYYVGNLDIENFLEFVIDFGAITHIVIPVVALVASMTIGEIKRRSARREYQ